MMPNLESNEDSVKLAQGCDTRRSCTSVDAERREKKMLFFTNMVTKRRRQGKELNALFDVGFSFVVSAGFLWFYLFQKRELRIADGLRYFREHF